MGLTQYALQGIRTEQQFWDGLEARINEAAEEHAELLVFPEYTTAHLLALAPPMSYAEACHYLDGFTAKVVQFFQAAGTKHGMVILGGTHICRENGDFVNKAHLFFPDGRIETQNKLHLTPEEQNQWKLTPGSGLNMIETKWGMAAILTCYDIEFPEAARIAAERGAELILCPSYTDAASGFYRVRNTCQARAIENQLFVALSGIVGELPEERPQIDKGYGQAGLFAPCDRPFPPDGILKAGETNENMTLFATIDFSQLQENRRAGIVAPFYDRRPDLYEKERRRIPDSRVNTRR
ncbi:hypothetical protein VN24_05835 [Paenibacillus beijingensis]|uniref:CN hydrolase domain-containing protein n=1 Tax=Paenibacillus beijingensis TaxID=1126833 RepID=A0A0D5NRB2_9BACL|nr:hypothetical protein VN24_05835 [Paenibacillus beijingensis]